MPGLTNQTREVLAMAFALEGSWVSLHTGDPGAAGANEAAGTGYTRAQTTWGDGGVADGIITGSRVLVEAGQGTYTHAGVWSEQTGGTFVGSAPIQLVTIGAAGGAVLVEPSFTVG